MALAREIVTIFHSAEDAVTAQKRWDDVFRSGKKDAVPDDIPESTLEGGEEKIVDILRRLEMVKSGKEAKQLSEQSGIKRDGVAVEDIQAVITDAELPVVLQVGKRKFVRLVK